MKLHRLVLTNYRGITHRDIEFPDRGVVVVSGANEVGKSSMIEALDLLLEAKDRSTKRDVKQVKPTHADVGTEVLAEISTGAYRFVYRKRFHKQALTELTVLSPRREQLTGDEAHERVLAILAETVDVELWRAQRVLQSGAMAPVELSGSNALARALDVAAGQSAALSGAEPLLVDQIDAEYRQYFTPTGKPTAEWSAATKRFERAVEQVTLCAADVAEVDDAVVRHGRLTERLASATQEQAAAVQRLEAARVAAATVTSLTDSLEQTRALVVAVAAAAAASTAAVRQRVRSCAELEVRAATIPELEADLTTATADHVIARDASAAAAASAAVARNAVEQCDARTVTARAAADGITRRDDAQRLAVRVAKVDAALGELRACETALASSTLTAAVMKAVETAAAAVERAAMQAELSSAQVEVTAAVDVTVMIDGRPVKLAAGSTEAFVVGATTDVDVPGLLTVRVVPGTPASDSQALLDAARAHLAELLARACVPDLESARALGQRRHGLSAERDRLTATCAGLLGDDDITTVRAQLVELQRDALPDCRGDAATARAELEQSVAAYRAAVDQSELLRDAAATAAAAEAALATRLGVQAERLAAARRELTEASEALEQQRSAVGDAHLAQTAAGDVERARAGEARVEALAAELAALAPAAVAAELADAVVTAKTVAVRHDQLGEQLRDVAAQLKVFGTQGRKGRLDDAESEREHAEAEHARLRRRSSAAELLRSVMMRHRDEARLRYVDPFRREVERLGRIVFGPDFEVEIDGELRICSRTVAGRTVPYESLSGGAKEQLGIVARLASAALVAKEDGVPVVIDDALGFTDAVRLSKMGEVFNAVGGDGQVIVLTCSPERYATVADARHVELTLSN